MTIRSNLALSEEPINQPIKIVTPVLRESLFSWLERTGRFQANEGDELQDHKVLEDLDDLLEPELYVAESEEEEL
jgi:hypothetical protein